MTNPATHDAPRIVKHWTESEPVRLAGHRAGRVYLAGPMTGLPEFNFPAFNAEAAILRAQGLTVINPAEHGIIEGAEWADYLRHDIAGLASCERIHLLRGWENSKGARLEVHIAQQLGMVITRQEGATLQAKPAEVSDEPEQASKVVNDSCWKFVEAMPHKIPGPIWNDLKPAIYAALIHYHRAILALRPQAVPMTDDTELLEFMFQHRAVVSLELEGGWDAELLDESGSTVSAASGFTPRDALRRLKAHHGITAQGAQGEQG